MNHSFTLCIVTIMYRVAVETLWNILPELKVEPDEELQTRVSSSLLYCVALQCEHVLNPCCVHISLLVPLYILVFCAIMFSCTGSTVSQEGQTRILLRIAQSTTWTD